MFEKIKEWDKKSWEKSIKEWREHPKSNTLIILFICGFYLFFGAYFVFVGFIMEKSWLGLVVFALCFAFAGYLWHIRNVAMKKAFPK